MAGIKDSILLDNAKLSKDMKSFADAIIENEDQIVNYTIINKVVKEGHIIKRYQQTKLKASS